MQPQDKDIDSLNKFWHWADHERPDRDLFDAKATAGGPLTEEAQEAMQQAVEVVGLRAPDVLHPSGEVLRPAIKLLSLAILEAWQLLKDDERIQKELAQQHERTSMTPAFAEALQESFNERIEIDHLLNEYFQGAVGEMGVTRDIEHDTYRQKLLDIMVPNDRQNLSVRVDSRGILFQSTEFKDIEMLCGFDEFETQDRWRIDDHHKLYLIINTLRLRVVQRKVDAAGGVKTPGMRTFPGAQNMFTGK